MTRSQTIIYILVLAILVFGLSSFMEFYKKVLRKGKTTTVENKLVALIISALPIIILNEIHIFQPLLGTLGAPIWADYIFYYIIIYIAQMQADMKLMKALIRSAVKILLSSYGFSQEQINEIFSAIDSKDNYKGKNI